MSGLFPRRPPVEHSPSDRASVSIEPGEQCETLGAVSSATAQAILAALGTGPATVSELAESVDTSVQNASYHLDRLCSAEVVVRAETWYSERGTPMPVYALAARRLVVELGDRSPDRQG